MRYAITFFLLAGLMGCAKPKSQPHPSAGVGMLTGGMITWNSDYRWIGCIGFSGGICDASYPATEQGLRQAITDGSESAQGEIRFGHNAIKISEPLDLGPLADGKGLWCIVPEKVFARTAVYYKGAIQ